jgi:hypothetical protein
VHARTDQSANQQENPVVSASLVTQEKNLITTKVEPDTEEIIVEKAHKELKNKLDSYNQEREQNHRQRTTQEGFLSDLWEESEMNASDSRIKMLKEDNDDLIKELNYKNRSFEEADQLVRKLKKEKNEWQELYLQVAPGKRPAETV